MNETPQHWSQIQEAGAIAGIKTLFWIYRLFGRPLLLLAMTPVLIYFFAIRSSARHASMDYFWRLHRFDPRQPRPTLWLSFKHFFSFADCLIDKLAAWSGQLKREQLELHNHQQFTGMIDQGRGAVILVSHLGNLEVCRMLAEINPTLRLNILLHTKNAQKFNQLAKKLDPQGNITLLQVSEFSPATAMMLNDKVVKGEFIAIAGDRTPVTSGSQTKNSSLVEFLGKLAPFPEGGHLLAGMLRCPLLMLYSLKQQQRYHIYFEILEENPRLPRNRRKEQLHQLAQRYAQRLEHYCQLAPLQWFNFYMFWQYDKQADKDNDKNPF